MKSWISEHYEFQGLKCTSEVFHLTWPLCICDWFQVMVQGCQTCLFVPATSYLAKDWGWRMELVPCILIKNVVIIGVVRASRSSQVVVTIRSITMDLRMEMCLSSTPSHALLLVHHPRFTAVALLEPDIEHCDQVDHLLGRRTVCSDPVAHL